MADNAGSSSSPMGTAGRSTMASGGGRSTGYSSISGGREIHSHSPPTRGPTARSRWRGRTHWSRAILASRRRRLHATHRARLCAPASQKPASRHDSSAVAAKGTATTPPLARKAKVLGRLVPGCRKLSFPTLLAETMDFIAMPCRGGVREERRLAAGATRRFPSGGGEDESGAE
ncbi:transcription factor bHLH147-like [Panicum virgatum]|uniref:transcription factor bHLH147-like n=1 Tax=Panicum virgatum TaxID=38727 RepID=UPI0019D5E0CC|nr:transcription factor bHLH147-like [Panicum virgatum]